MKGYIFIDLENLGNVVEPEIVANLIAEGYIIKCISYSDEKLDKFIRLHKLSENNRIICEVGNSIELLVASLVGVAMAHNEARKVILISNNGYAKRLAKLMQGLGHDCESLITCVLAKAPLKREKAVREALRGILEDCNKSVLEVA